jgi:uncharacterized protein YaiI (UPF0178 family)
MWIDADACPGVIKEILYRAAERVRVDLTLVANHQPLRDPASPYIRAVRVSSRFDVADRQITEQVGPGDLVITADIPLAADVVAKGAVALSPRGELYTKDNIRERLAMRDLMDGLRASGTVTDGPPALSKWDRQAFANQLDKLLARSTRA